MFREHYGREHAIDCVGRRVEEASVAGSTKVALYFCGGCAGVVWEVTLLVRCSDSAAYLDDKAGWRVSFLVAKPTSCM